MLTVKWPDLDNQTGHYASMKIWNKVITKTEKFKAFLISTEMIATIKTQMDGKKRYADFYITFKSQSVFSTPMSFTVFN